jgi:hypothetical protein
MGDSANPFVARASWVRWRIVALLLLFNFMSWFNRVGIINLTTALGMPLGGFLSDRLRPARWHLGGHLQHRRQRPRQRGAAAGAVDRRPDGGPGLGSKGGASPRRVSSR